MFRDFALKGFTEGMSGHISVRDPEFENYIWMNPLGKHFGCMTAGDLLCLDLHTGDIVGGNRVSSRLPPRAFTPGQSNGAKFRVVISTNIFYSQDRPTAPAF